MRLHHAALTACLLAVTANAQDLPQRFTGTNPDPVVAGADLDVHFDNPYQRSFSNYRRFKGTILEDYFRLEDPLFGFTYENAAQPQAERGFYVNTRYRITEQFITTDPDDPSTLGPAAEIYGLFTELLEERRREPADDLMTEDNR